MILLRLCAAYSETPLMTEDIAVPTYYAMFVLRTNAEAIFIGEPPKEGETIELVCTSATDDGFGFKFRAVPGQPV